ncbi:MurR/RpiR family transcriptional regulator [bacterium]|nr:MurR/RpiR family transcriptional regulator [bacterium]MBU4510481.1 MurR/RpiR family transcriptional regulator [bacterium]
MIQIQGKDSLPNGILRIKSQLTSLKPAERRVADYILDNINEVIHLSITKMAENAGVSEATVVKFCQHIGYSGYQELKIILAQAGEKDYREHIYGEIEANDDIDIIIKKIFQIYNQSLNNTKELLQNTDVKTSIEMILKARRLYFFGFGASGIVAEDADLKFKRINYISEALTDNHRQKTIGALLTKEDVVIAISDSGRTKELIESLKIVKNAMAKIIAITSNLGSPITKLADITLLTSSQETPFRGSALASRMAQLAVIDVLFLGAAVAEYDKTLEALNKTRLVMQESKL